MTQNIFQHNSDGRLSLSSPSGKSENLQVRVVVLAEWDSVDLPYFASNRSPADL